MTERLIKQFVTAFAVFTAAVIVISYGAITSYYTGYLDHFGINIRYIDFWPHLPDFLIVATPIVVGLIALVLLSFAMLYLLRWIGTLIVRKSKKRLFREFGQSFIWEKSVVLLSIFITLVIAVFGIVYGSQVENGRADAASETRLFSVKQDDKSIDVLIYQNGGVGFVKTYNKDTSTFESGFKTIEFTNQSLELVDLPKN